MGRWLFYQPAFNFYIFKQKFGASYIHRFIYMELINHISYNIGIEKEILESKGGKNGYQYFIL